MSSVIIQGNASGTGSVTVESPNTNSDYTLTLPAETGTILTDGGGGAGNFATLTVNSNNISADNSLGFRNRIINGDMRIDQRNAGASVTLTSGVIYTVDRFIGLEDTDGAMTAQQDSSAPVGFVNSLKLTTTTADATLGSTQFSNLQQRIEGTNVADLAWGTANAKTVTLSFWVRSSLTGTFSGSVSNSAFNRSYPFTYTISVADTWEYKTVTIPGDTTGTWLTTTGVGIRLVFSMGEGSDYAGTAGSWVGSLKTGVTGATSVIGTLDATWYVTGVQLEVGSVATPFERRPFGTELALCQRYYEFNSSAFSNPMFSGNVTSGNGYYANGVFKVTKRANPTVTLTSTFGANFPNTSGSASDISTNSFYEPRDANGTGQGYFASTFTASAEL